jgi:hypothetical protein
MPEPTRIEYVVGKTIHNQRVRLVWSVDPYGKRSWTVHRDELNQRDDAQRIDYLTDDVILAMAEAVRSRPKGGPNAG